MSSLCSPSECLHRQYYIIFVLIEKVVANMSCSQPTELSLMVFQSWYFIPVPVDFLSVQSSYLFAQAVEFDFESGHAFFF
jgi:hypothetical protein